MKDKIQLCPVLEGVQFTVQDDGVRIKAVILKEALQTLFGASETPQDWLEAYHDHRSQIDFAAITLHRLQPIWPVVVLRGHEPELAAARQPAPAARQVLHAV